MADETLRRNLEIAFDPGPDFPHSLLLSRTMAMLDAKATSAGQDAPWKIRRAFFSVLLPRTSSRLVAAVLMVVLVVAAVGGFLAVHEYSRRSVPVHTHPSSGSRSCSQGILHMVSTTVGWNGTSRTTDGGATWTNVSPPPLPDGTKAGRGICIFDAEHAWTTQSAGPSGQPDRLIVFATRDGGHIWQQGEPVAFGDFRGTALLEFIDDQHGWLVTDSGTLRTLYSTTDGGSHWSQVSTDSLAGGSTRCRVSGMTFTSLDKGWLTWACSQAPALTVNQASSPMAAATTDGGRSWIPVRLPSFPPSGSYVCDASAPLFSRDRGVLPVTCSLGGQPSWSAVFRTTDAGHTWSLGRLPASVAQLNFIDATTGFAFVSNSEAANDLYRTTDSGQGWVLVKKGLFSRQRVNSYQFIDLTTGFVLTDSVRFAPWKSTDGGKTWSLPAPYKSLPGNVACDAPQTQNSAAAPVPVKMFSPTTGWAKGALRTTDGGVHWANVAPPSVPDRSSGYTEFFLDADHAWVVQAAGSATACSDHIVVFSTADAGKTWQQAAPIQVAISDPTELIVWPRLDFVDASNGWLQVPTFQGFSPKAIGPLYQTTDGGLHWTVVSAKPAWSENPSCVGGAGISFVSTTTGWVRLQRCSISGDPGLILLVTHDGGVTWTPQVIARDCRCPDQPLPYFFDAMHGMLLKDMQWPFSELIVTSDGGLTWSTRSLPPKDRATTNVWTMTFIDPNNGWRIIGAVVANGNRFRLEHTGDGGNTWTVVNSDLAGDGTLTFVDPRNGFLATGTKLFKTSDGGRSWAAIETSIS